MHFCKYIKNESTLDKMLKSSEKVYCIDTINQVKQDKKAYYKRFLFVFKSFQKYWVERGKRSPLTRPH